MARDENKTRKLTPESKAWVVDKLAHGMNAPDIAKGLVEKFDEIKSYSASTIYDFAKRNQELIEARQAELTKQLWRYPIAHAFFQLRELTRIFHEAKDRYPGFGRGGHEVLMPPDWTVQMKCMEQAAAIMERVGGVYPGDGADKAAAETFLASFGFGPNDLASIRPDEEPERSD